MFTKKVLSVVFLVSFLVVSLTSFAYAQETTLTWWAWGTGHFLGAEPDIEKYTKLHPDIKFETTIVPWGDYWKKLLAGIAAGRSPVDIITFHNSQAGRFLEYLEPLPEDLFPLSRMRKVFFAIDEAYLMPDGKLHWTPGGTSAPLIFYDSEMWQEAGLGEPPKTWDELRKISKKLTKFDEEGRIEINGFQPGGVLYGIGYLGIYWQTLMYQLGGYMYNEDGTAADSSWVGPPGIKALTFLRNLIYEDRVFSPEFPTITDSFGSGVSAMVFCFSWLNSFMHANFPERKFGAFPIPTETGKMTPAVCHNAIDGDYAVLKIVPEDKKRKAFEFLSWLHNQDDYNIRTSLDMARLPAKKALWTDPRIVEDPVLSALAKEIPYSVFIGELPHFIQTNVLTGIDIRIFKGMAVEDVLKAAKEEADRILGENPVWWNAERKYSPPK